MTWTLVLTIMWASHSVAITTVPGFASREACLVEGSAWRSDVKAVDRNPDPIFRCMLVGK